MGLKWKDGLELRTPQRSLSLPDWLDELANQLYGAVRNNAVYIEWTIDMATDVADRAREYAKELREGD